MNEDIKFPEEVIKEHTEKLINHENRIQKLEDSNLHTQLKMSEIQKSQMKIELLMIENSNNQNKTLNEFTNKILDTFTGTMKSNNKTSNKIKITDRKELWGIIGAIVTFIITYLSKK